MANTIKIKRTSTNRRPGSLADGELASSEVSKTLWIGDSGGNILAIGGDGARPKPQARAATTATAGTYSNTGGTTGRGQLTSCPNTLDGVTLAAGDIILVKDHGTGAANGIYRVSTLGTGSNGVWDRVEWFDEQADAVLGPTVWVVEGSTNAGTWWRLSNSSGYTLGGSSGSSLTWIRCDAPGAFTAGTGISISSGTISISASYAGQSSITTLGTIGTGTWQGTAIGAAYGGTGKSSYTSGNFLYASGTTTIGERTPSQVLTDIGAAAASHTHSASDITSGTLGVARGGTGVGTLTGLVKGNGTSAFSAAVAGTDYLDPSSTIDGGTY